MSKCDLTLRLDRDDRVYRPGETVLGEVRVRVHAPCRCDMLVLSHFWRTHGKGNRDQGSPTMQNLFSGDWSVGEEQRYPFELTLPSGPVTYHGSLVNVDWYLEARAKIAWAVDPRLETEVILRPGTPEDYFFGPMYKPPAENLRQSDRGRRWGVFFGLVFAAAGVLLFAKMQADGSPVMGLVLGVTSILVGGLVFLGNLWRDIAQQKIGVPEVSLDRTALAPGDQVGAHVRFSPRSPLTLAGVSAELVCREEAESGTGTDRTTNRNDVHRIAVTLDQPGRAVEAGEVVSLEGTLRVPDPAPLTFAAKNNRILWTVEVTIRLAAWPDWKRRFPVTVGPAAARAPAGTAAGFGSESRP
jgi:sporulation-control protein spo0M